MNLMDSRVWSLQEALAGQQLGAPPLVGHAEGRFVAAGFQDDVGLYYFAPKIANTFGLSVVDAAGVFLGGLALAGALVGAVGVMLLFRSWMARAAALSGLLLLTCHAMLTGDVYVVFAATATASVPLFLVLVERRSFGRLCGGFCLLTGLAAGISHSIRAHSGTGLLLFLLVMIVAQQQLTRSRRLVLIAALLLGAVAPWLHFRAVIANRDAFLAAQDPTATHGVNGHPFWHSVYIGLGYLENPYQIRWNDQFAAATVARKDPNVGYCTAQYEAILRAETLHILRTDFSFVLRTVLAKCWAVLLLVVKFANVGLLAALCWRKPRAMDVAFIVAILFNSLFGIVVMPRQEYLMGLIAFSALFGIVSLGHALDRGALAQAKHWLGLGFQRRAAT